MRISTTALAGALGATVLAAGLVHLWRRKVISARRLEEALLLENLHKTRPELQGLHVSFDAFPGSWEASSVEDAYPVSMVHFAILLRICFQGKRKNYKKKR